jgi:predicted GTPase
MIAAAEVEAEIVVWDDGNNDFSFIRPDFDIAVADALRTDAGGDASLGRERRAHGRPTGCGS